MNGLIIGYFSYSFTFKSKYIDSLLPYGLRGRSLIDESFYDANRQFPACLLIHMSIPLPLQSRILSDINAKIPNIPTLMITDASSQIRAHLLARGINDVVSSDIQSIELYQRIAGLYQRHKGETNIQSFGSFTINQHSREIRYEDILLPLKPREYFLLDYLLRHASKPVSRRELLAHLWNCRHDPGTNSVEVHIWRLRTILSEYIPYPIIETVRGQGYRIREQILTP